MSYKDKFDESYYGAEVIAATKHLAEHIWSDSTEERIIQIKAWIARVSELLGVEMPEYQFINDAELYCFTGGGCYNKLSKTIQQFKKFSLVTILHEFAHHLQHYTYNNTDEEFARSWSVSLYYICCPNKYAVAVQKGTLRFV